MTSVTALSGKVKFANTGKTQYRVEHLIDDRKTKWSQTFKSYVEAIDYVKQAKLDLDNDRSKYLITEIFTKTLGVF